MILKDTLQEACKHNYVLTQLLNKHACTAPLSVLQEIQKANTMPLGMNGMADDDIRAPLPSEGPALLVC